MTIVTTTRGKATTRQNTLLTVRGSRRTETARIDTIRLVGMTNIGGILNTEQIIRDTRQKDIIHPIISTNIIATIIALTIIVVIIIEATATVTELATGTVDIIGITMTMMPISGYSEDSCWVKRYIIHSTDNILDREQT